MRTNRIALMTSMITWSSSPKCKVQYWTDEASKITYENIDFDEGCGILTNMASVNVVPETLVPLNVYYIIDNY